MRGRGSSGCRDTTSCSRWGSTRSICQRRARRSSTISIRKNGHITTSSGATLKGTIRGDETVDYRLRATVGQILDVNLQANNRWAYFNVLPPDDETALFVGSVSGNSFNGALPRDGEYTVRVYLMRNAARRNESARYTVNFTMASSKAVSGTAATNPPAIYDASGKIKCATGNPPLDQWCDFRVVRHLATGSAQIRIAHRGAPRQRVLHYAGKRFSTSQRQ